jgi:hypothetical protein
MGGIPMGIWILILLFGISAFLSFYMAFLALEIKESGIYLFACLGLLFGILFFITLIKAVRKKSGFLKSVDEKLSGKPEPVRFVPHQFMMWAIIIAGIGIVAAIVIPIFFR